MKAYPLNAHSLTVEKICGGFYTQIAHCNSPTSNKEIELRILIDPEETLFKYRVIDHIQKTITWHNCIAAALLQYNLIP